MALQTKRPEEVVSDMGQDSFIREVRELWIKYADPKYLDLLDVDFVPTLVTQPDLDSMRIQLQ